MMESPSNAPTKATSFHFVGIGGIGMSGLAQMMAAEGYTVTGSDRGLNQPENSRIFDSLKKQGITLFPQDGSFAKTTTPDALIFSTAIEEDNPDFTSAPDIPKIHRSKALSEAMQRSGQSLIAVTGSCGKTTVSSWLAECLYRLNFDPSLLTGGLANTFATNRYAGNFHAGQGDIFVFEADESDKSLTAYHPDYAMILNIGTDHYSKEELVDLFTEFLCNVQKGAVIEENVAKLLGDNIPEHLETITFCTDPEKRDTSANWQLTSYHSTRQKILATFNSSLQITLPAPGIHTAANALAIMAMTELLDVPPQKTLHALQKFNGVWRRFDLAGKLPSGATVYDDYAHNVEKIISSMSAAHEVTDGKVVTVFQPHGFGPLGFMQEELFKALEEHMSNNDIFAFLPVFYAGGSSSFAPTSKEVVSAYVKNGTSNYTVFDDRQTAVKFLGESTENEDTVLILGARDNSLSDWAKSICT